MNKVLAFILTFLVVCSTGFFSAGYLSASSEEDVQEEALDEEDLIPEEDYEPFDQEEPVYQLGEEERQEEEYLSAEEERYVPDPEEIR